MNQAIASINMDHLSAEQFNQRFKVGSPFKYYRIKGHPGFIWATTRSEAWELGSGDVVVKINSVSGGVAIDHLAQE